MNYKINQELLTVLSKGYVENEEEFKVFFSSHHEIVNVPNATAEKIQLVNIRLHLSGGYCQVQVYEKSCKYAKSLLGIYEPTEFPLRINFYNYQELEVVTFRKLQESYINTEVKYIKNKYIGMETTIEALALICNHYFVLNEEIGYYVYLEEGSIPFAFCVLDDKSVLNVVLEFDILDEYFLYTADAWEILKEIHIRVTGVRLVEFFPAS